MKHSHRFLFLGVFLVIVPPVAAVAMAALSVGLTRHDDATKTMPAIYDALFPIFFLASFFSVPIGIYLIIRALKKW